MFYTLHVPPLGYPTLRHSEAFCIEIAEGDGCIFWERGLREIEACTDADVQMGGAVCGVTGEEGEEDGPGGSAPDVGVCDAEDEGVVGVAQEAWDGVDGCSGSCR